MIVTEYKRNVTAVNTVQRYNTLTLQMTYCYLNLVTDNIMKMKKI